MFQAFYAHHQEAECIDAASGIVLSVTGRPVHRLRENCSAVIILYMFQAFYDHHQEAELY